MKKAKPRVILKGYIFIPTDKLDKTKFLLEKHIMLTKKEVGCILFEVTKDSVDESKFHVYEEFRDEEAFRYHQKRSKESEWGKFTKDFKRDYKIT